MNTFAKPLTPIEEQFRIQLIASRRSADLSQVELADEVGVSQKYISLIENGERVPRLDLAYRLAGCFQRRGDAALKELLRQVPEDVQ